MYKYRNFLSQKYLLQRENKRAQLSKDTNRILQREQILYYLKKNNRIAILADFETVQV